MLTAGTEIRLDAGGTAQVARLLGVGGQGFVYEVTRDRGDSLALKAYKRVEDGQEEELSELIDRGSPGERFVWPITLARSKDNALLGYVMRVLPPDYVGLTDFMRGADKLGVAVGLDYAPGANLCYQLARSFLKVHALGLCYRDINSGNVFLHRQSGDALIVDNDNVGIDGTPSRVLGVGEFMAPEVVRRLDSRLSGSALPSARTDRHSLAVALFFVLCGAHPLEGAKTAGPMDPQWQVEHYGRDPAFIFDPARPDNHPLEGEVPLKWFDYPQFVRDLFMKAFTVGLRDPDERVLEDQWADAMLRLRDSIRTCPQCHQTVFDDATATNGAATSICRGCNGRLQPPLRLVLGRRRPVIEAGTKLWTDQILGEPETTMPVAVVMPHPADISRLGIKNLCKHSWSATDRDANVHSVPPGRSIEAKVGMRIDFGKAKGVIEC